MRILLALVMLLCSTANAFAAPANNPKPNLKEEKQITKTVEVKKPTGNPQAFWTDPKPGAPLMRTPNPAYFHIIRSKEGKYSLLLPYDFGENALKGLPCSDGPMLFHSVDSVTLFAINVIDPTDNSHYGSIQALPTFQNKRVYWKWNQDAALLWTCRLSQQNDFYGNKIILEAEAKQGPKTYQLLYSFPDEKLNLMLPLVLYSLNSFKLEK